MQTSVNWGIMEVMLTFIYMKPLQLNASHIVMAILITKITNFPQDT